MKSSYQEKVITGNHEHDCHDHRSHQHTHGSHNHHDEHATASNERKILISFFIIAGFMLVEAIGGVISGSLALIADAGHMLTDAAALGLAYLAFRFGKRVADKRRTFGYLRFEVIAGLANALTLFGIVAWIVYEAIERFNQPQPILVGPMFAVAVIGTIVNLFVLWYLTRGETDHVNVKGAILHVMGDLLGSAGAIMAAVVILTTGWTPIDPILSVLVALLVLRSAWSLLKKTMHILLEGAPTNADAISITSHLLQTVDGIEKISHVHVWLITSGRSLATLQVQPKEGVNLPSIVKKIEDELKEKFGIEHPTVGIDWHGDSSCSLENAPKLDAHAGHNH
jgi:cobalt-zinc-cadmium efflux system protein